MEKEFVPYELALRMKQLGFNENCLFAWCNKGGWNKYTGEREPITQVLRTDGNPFGDFFNGKNWNREIISNTKSNIQCSAPLFQQAFRWFREKYNIHIRIEKYDENKWWANWGSWTSEVYDSYEEAEISCIEKLIEIVEQSKKG